MSRVVWALLLAALPAWSAGPTPTEAPATEAPATEAPATEAPAPVGPEAAEDEVTPLTFDEGGIPPELVELALSVRDRPIGERMAAISAPMMDLPYLGDAVGEGVPPDLDPPARYDAYDCLTFVEEVLALALPADPRSAPAVRRSLRYGEGASVAYDNRHHFMLQQWVPRAIENGWLKDITSEVGETHLLRKSVTAKTWAWWKKRSLFHLRDDQLPTGDYALPVLSTGAAREAVDRIPDGALILTVRQSKDYVPIVVTHLGFKVPSKPEVPLMRHATRMGKQPRVRNERLTWYLEHVQWYHHWPVEGVTVLMPQEFGPRRSRLVALEEGAPDG